MNVNGQPFRTVWMDGATVRMINQPLLPYRFELVALPTVADTAASIRDMVVRGAVMVGLAFSLVCRFERWADANPTRAARFTVRAGPLRLPF